MWAILAPPKPLNPFQSRLSVCAIFRKVPNFFKTLRARSRALVPRVPVRRRIARSSELLKAPAPFLSNFSRGRSSSGQLLIPDTFFFFTITLSLPNARPYRGQHVLINPVL